MGEVGIPACGGGTGSSDAEAMADEAAGAAAQAAADAQQTVVAQADAPTDQVKAHEAGARCGAAQVGFVGMQAQAQFSQVCLQRYEGLSKGLRAIGEKGQIIHVAQTGPDAGQGTEAVIDGVEVQIRQKLAGEIADGQPPWPFQGCEQGVAGEPIDGGTAAGAIGQDGAEQPEGARAGDQLLQLGEQEKVIDGWEIKADVGLQHPGMFAAGAVKATQGTMGAVALAVGVTGGNEVELKRRSHHRDQGVMHDPITEGGGTHHPGFGLAHHELPVRTGRIGEAPTFMLQLKEFALQIGAKGENIWPVPLAPAGLAESSQQGGEGRDAGIEIPQRWWSLGHQCSQAGASDCP